MKEKKKKKHEKRHFVALFLLSFFLLFVVVWKRNKLELRIKWVSKIAYLMERIGRMSVSNSVMSQELEKDVKLSKG